MATVAEKLITAEEFIEMPDPRDGSKQELIRGVVVAMPPPGFNHGVCQLRVGGLMDHHARTNQQGRVTVESGVITERDPDTVRGPDVSFWSKERLPFHLKPKGYPDVAPDLCVEVLSPFKKLRLLLQKLKEYFERGVRMVWIIDPEERTVTVYRSATEGKILHESATLSGEDVLPGFSCRVADLFD